MTDSNQIPKWFIVVAVLAIIWNAMGVMAYIMDIMLSAEDIVKLSEAEQDLRGLTPVWAKGAFAIAVFAGLIGSILLLVKKTLALPVLIASLIAICVQMYNAFFIMDSVAVFGPGSIYMPIMIVVIAILLIWFAVNAKTKHWIN